MANQSLFAAPRYNVPATDAVNSAGGVAYNMSPDAALAVFSMTGCFNSTFYSTAQEQLDKVKVLANQVSTTRLAKIAVVSRTKGFMKDMPAYLTAVLYVRDPELWKRVFPKVIDNPKMLRTYAQIARSGAAGKVINLSSSSHRKAISKWFNDRHSDVIFKGSVGNNPSLVGVLRQAHVRPGNREKEALLKYLFNNEFGWTHVQAGYEGRSLGSTTEDLPALVKHYEAFKANKDGDVGVPDVDFRQIDALGLNSDQWAEVFRNAKGHFVRMNLNTAVRQGVLAKPGMTQIIADKLRNPGYILHGQVFPYQLFTAFLATRGTVPHEISEALQDAVELSLDNVPPLGQTVIAVDVSNSMGNPVTGDRGTATTKTRAVDVAALIASAIIRKNKSARVIPFSNGIKDISINCRDSIMTNASKLAGLLGGGTNCSAPLAQLNLEGYKADAVVYLSDNESWVDSRNPWNPGNGTRMHEEWLRYKKHNPKARLIGIDLSPNTTVQVQERPDILQVAGFSDSCFRLMYDFVEGGNSKNFWLDVIDKVEV